MQTIYAQIDKRRIDEMPPVLFDGRIVMVSSQKEAEKAVAYLRRFPELGLDTETRPNFHKGEGHKVSLLQLSTKDTCFLFRLCMIGIPDCLADLLCSKTQLKVGLSMGDDIRALNQRRQLKFGRYVDLQKTVREVGIMDMSLQKVYANLFGRKIGKGQRLTNWEAPALTASQQRYAATDAWACLRIYHRLEKLRTGMEYRYIAPMDDERMFQIWLAKLLDDTHPNLQNTNTYINNV